MQSLDMLLLSFALGVDAAAVAFSIGLAHPDKSHRPGVRLAAWFGSFQALMATLGWLFAHKVDLIRPWADKGAGLVFIVLGIKLCWDAWQESEEASLPATHQAHLLLALATSLDAMAAGVGLAKQDSPWSTITLIGLVAFGMTMMGALASRKMATFPEKYLATLGALVLFFLGVKNFV